MRLVQSLEGARKPFRSPPRRNAARASKPIALHLLLTFAGLQTAWALAVFLMGRTPASPIPATPIILGAVGFSGAGAVLARAGRRDPRALSLAGFFLCMGAAPAQHFLPHVANSWAGIVAAFLPETFLPFFLWRFTREFPRILRLDRWALLVDGVVRFSAVVGIALLLVNAAGRFAPTLPTLTPWVRWLRQPADLYWMFLSALCLPALLFAWARCQHAEPDERRRVRWFLSGLAFGVLPLFGEVLAEAIFPGFERWMSRPEARQSGAVVLYGFLLTVPITTTYAVVAGRVLEIRLLLRNAARLALARVTVAAGAAMPALLLLAHLYRERDHPLAWALVQEPAPSLLIFTAAGGILFTFRGFLLRRLEKTLLGRREDSHLVLASFARDAQNARTANELTRQVQERAAELVTAERAALLLRDETRHLYVPAEPGLRALTSSSGLILLLEATPEPVLVADEEVHSVLPWLLEDDRRWIEDSGAHLLLPLIGSRGEMIAVLVLGAMRSGLPYSRDDQRAAIALATAAALVLERIGGPGLRIESVEEEGPAGECRDCGRITIRPEGECACGNPLSPAPIPFELGGKFRLERVLGEGGMGVVYRALDLGLGRRVALKTLPNLGSEALLRLRREARSMAGFIHPNLALIFGLETWRGVPVLVVEYLEHGSLADRLRQAGRINVSEALRLGIDLASALEKMHHEGLLHRDVKPSNIGFSAEETPKLLDFGLARLVDEALGEPRLPSPPLSGFPDSKLRMTLTGNIVGTPLYLSPEALRGLPPAPAQDLWSLHLVLWEALAGKHPLSALPFEAAIRRLAKGEVPDIRTIVPECPQKVAELLSQGLHSDVRRRWPSAQDARSALLQLVDE